MLRKWDIWVSVVLVVLCGIVFLETLKMPPAFYDPLGPAFFPRALCVVIAGLSLALLAQTRRASAHQSILQSAPADYEPSPSLGLLSTLLTLIYLVGLQFEAFRFGPMTALYVTAFALLLSWGREPRVPLKAVTIAIGVGIFVGFGSEFVFKEIFYVDLP